MRLPNAQALARATLEVWRLARRTGICAGKYSIHAGRPSLRESGRVKESLPPSRLRVLHRAIATGQLLNSRDLNKRFSQERFVCKVYLATDGHTLILSTLFQ